MLDMNKIDGPARIVIGILVICMVCGLAYVTVVQAGSLGDVAERLLTLILGATLANFNTVIQYFFGSSSGSANKDRAIQQLATSSPDGSGQPPSPPSPPPVPSPKTVNQP